MTAPLLTVDGLKTGFGAVTVLHDLSFEVPRGQVTAILGLNGAGKSVMLKTVAGLIPSWRGSIRLGDRDLAGMTPEQRVAAGMGHVTQGRQVFPELTVEENLRVGAYLLRRRDRRRYAELLDRMYTQFPRLRERHDQPAGTMSGGEQAMLAVARSLMNEPELLLVDEPSAGLAPVIVEELLVLLRDVANSGVTILLVEQNVAFALEVADRALIMQRGSIVYGGDTSELDRSSLSHYLGIGRLLNSRVAPVASAPPTPAQGNGRTTTVRRQRVKAAPALHHKGGGWYALPDGSTIRGKQAALDALDALRRNGGGA